ncbi:MAG TPA: signal peptidase I [Gaiellaceae bacterium]|nr:signal peptidase I [Gaiellaceae bacterium]
MRSSGALGTTARTFGILVVLGATLAHLSRAAATAVGADDAAPAETPPAAASPPPRSLTLSTALNALGLALAIAAVVGWALLLRPQALGGPAGYVLVSGKSMLPRYHTGDLVLVERHSSYHVGQVIAYRVPKGDPMAGAQVIHRIVGGDAQHGFLVQGDNRTAPDVWRPKPADIVGAKLVRIPDAIVVLQYLRSPLTLGLLAAALVFVRVLAFGGDSKPAERLEDDTDLARSA